MWAVPEDSLKKKRVLVFPGSQELITRINDCHYLTSQTPAESRIMAPQAPQAPQELSCPGFVAELLSQMQSYEAAGFSRCGPIVFVLFA